ncbi:Neprilysin-4 [Mortierella alpina]|nr:Neprilysin-4 [Mortierella alpina]
MTSAGFRPRTVSLQQLSNLSYHVNWALALRRALPDDVDLPTSVTLFGIFFEMFDGVLEHLGLIGPLPLQIQSYLVWNLVKHMTGLIDPKYGHFLHPYPEPKLERWRYCVDVVNWTMGRMVAPFFVKQVSSEHETVHEMVDSIRSQLAEAYECAAGIDNSTKLRGMRTLNESRPFVGIDGASYAAESSAEIEDFYRNLTNNRNDYFGNRKNFAMWYRANSYRGVKGFVHRDHLDLLPQSNDIRQDTDGSNLQIPAGVLRPPLFHDEYPEYVNFGSLGAMIAERYMNALDLGEGDSNYNLNFSTCIVLASSGKEYHYFRVKMNEEF